MPRGFVLFLFLVAGVVPGANIVMLENTAWGVREAQQHGLELGINTGLHIRSHVFY